VRRATKTVMTDCAGAPERSDDVLVATDNVCSHSHERAGINSRIQQYVPYSVLVQRLLNRQAVLSIDHTAFHDQMHILQQIDVLEHVATHRDDVGFLAG